MYSKQFIFILQVRNCPSQPQSTVIGTGGHRGAVGIGQQQRFGLVVKRRRLLQQFALQLRIVFSEFRARQSPFCGSRPNFLPA